MVILEFWVQLFACICFGWLYYRLAVLWFSLPFNLSLLRSVKMSIVELMTAIEERPELDSKGRLAYTTNHAELFAGPSTLNPGTMMAAVLRMEAEGKGAHWMAARYQLWLQRLGMNWTRHASLGNTAIDWGVWFTVTGTILVFAHLGATTNQFDALSSLGLCTATTAAGLLLAMAVRKLMVGKFAEEVKVIDMLAREALLLLVEFPAVEAPVPNAELRERVWGSDSFWEVDEVDPVCIVPQIVTAGFEVTRNGRTQKWGGDNVQ